MLRNIPISDSNAFLNRIINVVNTQKIVGGSDIIVSETPYGSSVHYKGTQDIQTFRFAGSFNINAEYYPNQIVYVDPNNNYYCPAGTYSGSLIPFGVTSIYSASAVPINAGLWICTQYVPPAINNETWLQSYVAPQYKGGIPPVVVQSTRIYTANVYYPVYPVIPSNLTSSYMTAFGVSIVANNTFWTPLSPTIAMQTCNGLGTVFASGWLSGSAFNTNYLPVH